MTEDEGTRACRAWWCGEGETGRDDQELIAAFEVYIRGDAGPPASDAPSCEHTPQDSD